MGIVIPLVLILLTCLVIWRACDGFEIASEYIGRNLSDGVRGGTINAISSSIPELFTTLIALFVLSDRDGFSIGIGTTAGSALFNGMIIPAVCILSVVGFVVLGVRVTSVNVSTRVLLRDGISLILCEFILILLINGEQLHWWQGLILMLMYVAYLAFMLTTMKPSELSANVDDSNDEDTDQDEDNTPRGVLATIFYWVSGGPLLDLERWFVKDHHREQMKQETWNGWGLLLTSTGVIGIACWALVLACEWLGSGPANTENPSYQLFGQTFEGLGMPAMFVAVIFASMATSVPDTVMSIRDARDGDYDDAVANALGSNIFDICFALGFPLFLFTLIHGPIAMEPEIAAQSGELRLFLFILTIIGFLIYYIGKRGVAADGTKYVEMKRGKAFALLTMYVLFVSYILAHENDVELVHQISDRLQSLLQQLPAIGAIQRFV
ncbi:sodium:calcium antiporter [Rhodopirellula bahusiensis]|uniref:Pseudouridine synthase n=1 Tax=Rhodopirellula bahusiensis TaxID=2014065 RepID=A0A2G1W939_9BACT|nr:pseudouridine synthase [Rhodopirellula bahusiensis]PHQ35531.1 pseudouridine synthase [Rhodopirellula bahusiensis]